MDGIDTSSKSEYELQKEFDRQRKDKLNKVRKIIKITSKLEKLNNVKIELVDWAVANRFGDLIEIHRDLIYFPDLYWSILKHELEHKRETGFKWFDLKHDMFSKIPTTRLLVFMLERPKTWIQVLPIYYQKGKGIVYDINKIIIYTIPLFLMIASFLAAWFFL